MKTNRYLKDLLILLRDYIINQEPSCFVGMCYSIYEMYHVKWILRSSELKILSKLLTENKPNEVDTGDLWFPKGEKPPRIDWLNNEISKL